MRPAVGVVALGLATFAGGCGGGAPSGSELWLANCASCHGALGQGTTSGPDLIYEVGPLTEDEVIETVMFGFGTMGPVNLTEVEAEAVADFVVNDLR